jgi:hypothetical protein
MQRIGASASSNEHYVGLVGQAFSLAAAGRNAHYNVAVNRESRMDEIWKAELCDAGFAELIPLPVFFRYPGHPRDPRL